MLLSSAHATNSQSLIDDILAQELPEDEQRPHVVFDLDDTVLTRDEDAYTNQAKILARFPESLVLPYHYGAGKYCKFIAFPEMMEVFLILLQRGWNIDFFSAGIEDRNKTVVTSYFIHMLARYTDTPESALESLFKNRLRIFSRPHLTPRDRKNRKKHAMGGKMKKDLSPLGVPLEDIVLVEDNRTYVIGGDQYPYLHATLPRHQEDWYYRRSNGNLDASTRTAFTRFGPPPQWDSPVAQPHITSYDQLHYPCADYAAFYAGVFGECYDAMRGPDKLSLRAALSQVLLRKDYDPDNADRFDTPWHLDDSGAILPEDLYGRWLERGRADIAKIKAYRREDYVPSADPFKEMVLKLYGADVDLKASD